jgi:DNA-directed RNA polymerase specialized sigma24 family protein
MSSSLPKVKAAGCARIEQTISLEDLVRSSLVADYETIRRFLRTCVRSISDAEDILHNFCPKALRHVSEIRRAETVGSWLNCVLRTTLVDYFRQAGADARRLQAYTDLASSVVPSYDPAPGCCSNIGPVDVGSGGAGFLPLSLL